MNEKRSKFTDTFSEAQRLRNLLAFPLFCEIVSSGVIVSLAAFEIVTINDLFSMRFAARFNLAIYSVMELLILSRASENMKMETEKIAEKIYESRWFDVEREKGKIRKMVQFSMLRASIDKDHFSWFPRHFLRNLCQRKFNFKFVCHQFFSYH